MCLNQFQDKICEDIRRKFDLMQEKWQASALSETVKVRVAQLADGIYGNHLFFNTVWKQLQFFSNVHVFL